MQFTGNISKIYKPYPFKNKSILCFIFLKYWLFCFVMYLICFNTIVSEIEMNHINTN